MVLIVHIPPFSLSRSLQSPYRLSVPTNIAGNHLNHLEANLDIIQRRLNLTQYSLDLIQRRLDLGLRPGQVVRYLTGLRWWLLEHLASVALLIDSHTLKLLGNISNELDPPSYATQQPLGHLDAGLGLKQHMPNFIYLGYTLHLHPRQRLSSAHHHLA